MMRARSSILITDSARLAADVERAVESSSWKPCLARKSHAPRGKISARSSRSGTSTRRWCWRTRLPPSIWKSCGRPDAEALSNKDPPTTPCDVPRAPSRKRSAGFCSGQLKSRVCPPRVRRGFSSGLGVLDYEAHLDSKMRAGAVARAGACRHDLGSGRRSRCPFTLRRIASQFVVDAVTDDQRDGIVAVTLRQGNRSSIRRGYRA